MALAAVAASLAVAGPADAAEEVTVEPGDSIQAAIDDAQPGDTISVGAGVFHENLTITTDDLTLRGAGSGRNGTILMPAGTPTDSPCTDPEGPAVEGICILGTVDPATGDPTGPPIRGVTVQDLTVEGFSGDGIFAFSAEDVTVERVRARENGAYGIVGFVLSGVSYVDNVAIRNGEPGFYIGDSPDAQAVVVGNTSIENGVGVEGFGFLFRDASHGVVLGNRATRNCLGFIFVDTALNDEPAADWTAVGNTATRNNGACPSNPEDEESLPAISGTGMLIAGADDVVLRKNVVLGNRPTTESDFSGGIVVMSAAAFGGGDPTGNVIARNVALHNQPADIVWDETGADNSFRGNLCGTSIPEWICGD
jgi:nitrous oxidase accessory protein NosD